MATPNYTPAGFTNTGATPGVLNTPQKTYSSLQPVNISQVAQKNAQASTSPNNANAIGGLINSGLNAVKNFFSTPAQAPAQTSSKPYVSPTSLSYNPTNSLNPASLGTNPGLLNSSTQPYQTTVTKTPTSTTYNTGAGQIGMSQANNIPTNKTNPVTPVTPTNPTTPTTPTNPANQNTNSGITAAQMANLNAGLNMDGSPKTPAVTNNQPTDQTNTQNTQTNTQTTPTLDSAATNLSNTAAGNQAIAQNAQNIANQYTGMINPLLENSTGQEIGYQTGMGTNSVGVGNAGVVQTATGNLVQGLTNQEQQALAANSQELTAQNQQANAYNQVGGLVHPEMQFGQLTNVAGNNAGQPISGGAYGDNPQLQAAVSQAVQLAQKAGPNDPSVQALLSTFGMPGQVLFNQAMQQQTGGSYNPATMSTQVATNNANLTKAQTESVDTGKALQQIDAITPVLTNFLSNSGMNPYQAQLFNGPVSDYVSKIAGSGTAAQWSAQMSDLKNYTSQLISSGYGGTPSGAEASTLSQDPSKLSYKDLTSYLQTLKDLGGNRKAVLDSTIQQLGGSSGYTGNQTQQVNSTTPSSTVSNPAGSLVGGVGLGLGSWAMNSASNLGGDIVGFIAKGLIK